MYLYELAYLLEHTWTTPFECLVDSISTLLLSVQESASISPQRKDSTVPLGFFRFSWKLGGRPLRFDCTVPEQPRNIM